MDSFTKNKKKVRVGSLRENAAKYDTESQAPPFSETLNSLVFTKDNFSAISLPQHNIVSDNIPSRTFVEDTAFYHAALDEHILTFVIDRNAKIQNISPPLCDLLNYQKEELVSQSLDTLQPRCHQEINFDQVWIKLNNGDKWEGEVCFTTLNCQYVWLNITLVPRCSEPGSADFILAICSDITATKNKLNQAQSFVESAVHDSQTTTGLLSLDGSVLFFNKVALERSSVQSSNIIGKKIWDTPWLEGFTSSKELIKQSTEACRNGESQMFQMGCLLSGRNSQVSIVLRPLLDEQGEVCHLFLEAWDISLNQDVQKALQRSELKYKALADATNIGFAELDLDKRLLSANRQLIELLGYTSVRALHRQPLQNWVSEQDRSSYENAFFICVSKKQFQRVELQLIHADKTLLPVEIFFAQLIIEGQEKFLCFVQDISKRKDAQLKLQQSEERLMLALAGSDAALWDWSPSAGADFDQGYDVGWKRLLGYESDDLFGDIESWGEQIHPWDRPQALSAFMEVLLGLTPVFEQEYRLRHKSGRWVWVLGRGKIMQRDADGAPLRIAGTIVDITQKKQVEEERLTMISKLQQAEKLEALGLLSAGVAHDFNNILVSIIGYADLAKIEMKQLPETRLDHYVDQIINSGQRARELIQQLMRYSRKEVLNISPSNLAPLTREVIQLVLGTMPRSVQISLNLDENCSLVQIDSILFHQVLINLCVNARDAMENDGQIDIRLYEHPLSENSCSTCMAKISDTQVVLEVTDNGPGIPEELQQQIFDPFFTTKDIGQGTGIGLASVHRIMHELGGHISLDTSPSRGTTFRLFFSVLEPAANGD